MATTIENATIEQSAIGLNPPPRRRRSRIAWALWPACWAYTAVLVAIWIVLATLSDRWWLATVIMFGPRWIWGLPLVVLLPATLILCRRGLLPLSIAGIVLLVGVMRFCVPLPRFAAAGSGGVGLRMVTCNAHYRHLDSAALAAFIRDVKPDIVLVQACLSRRDPVILGEGWFWRRSGEMYIASRLPILDDSAPDDGAFQTGNGSAARFRLTGPGDREFDIFSVHLATPREGLTAVIDNWWDGAGEMAQNSALRSHQSHALREWTRRSIVPCLVAGDFNTPTDSTIYWADWSDLTNAFSEAGFGFGYTHYTNRTRLRIDHILVGADWQVKRCWTGPSVGSPHRPLIADLQWNGGRAASAPGAMDQKENHARADR